METSQGAMTGARTQSSARDFFLYVGAMVLFYISFGSLLTLIFNYINFLFPDPLVEQRFYYDPYSGAIRLSLAMLIILFPFYWAAQWFINRDMRAHPEKQDLWIRKWLLYLTLFVGVGVVIGDLVVLVNTFLNGEITTRFILKILAVLVLAGFAVMYYWYDLRGRYITQPMLGRSLGIVAAAIVVISVVGGFFIIGTPGNQRLVRFDQQKIYDLQNIQSQILTYWQAKERLPANLDELKDPLVGQHVPVDTQTGEPYEYRVKGPLAFEVCATFNKEGVSSGANPMYYGPEPVKPGATQDDWRHAAGRVCFDRTIDAERYPPFSKQR